jgi:hypothetical protein
MTRSLGMRVFATLVLWAVAALTAPSPAAAIKNGQTSKKAPAWAAYVTTVSRFLFTQTRESSCTGTIVADGWVMTAAHCVVAEDASGHPISTPLPISKFEVVLGRSDLSKTWQGRPMDGRSAAHRSTVGPSPAHGRRRAAAPLRAAAISRRPTATRAVILLAPGRRITPCLRLRLHEHVLRTARHLDRRFRALLLSPLDSAATHATALLSSAALLHDGSRLVPVPSGRLRDPERR